MAHKAMRRRLDPVVQSGTVPCARCGELIEPGSPWQLDHRDDGRGWLGPSHQRCNARAGWEKMVAANGHSGSLEEQPYRWSQRWSADPPPGTTVNLGGDKMWSYQLRTAPRPRCLLCGSAGEVLHAVGAHVLAGQLDGVGLLLAGFASDREAAGEEVSRPRIASSMYRYASSNFPSLRKISARL
jgi:hypothetical protein